MEILPLDSRAQLRKQKKHFTLERSKSKISEEDAEIIASLNNVVKELTLAHNSFELANTDALIDSFIFEIMSLNKRYEYYIKLCKERGLIAEGIKT